MKSNSLKQIGRNAMHLVALAVVAGCGATATTDRPDKHVDVEKLENWEDVEGGVGQYDGSDSNATVTIDTARGVGVDVVKTSPWSFEHLSLDIYQKDIIDSSEHASFRFHVRNSSDSLAVIDRVEPSCGCIMATVQKSFAVKGKEGEIYVGLVVSRMSDIQPYTIDVYTTLNPDKPLRLTLRKVAAVAASGK